MNVEKLLYINDIIQLRENEIKTNGISLPNDNTSIMNKIDWVNLDKHTIKIIKNSINKFEDNLNDSDNQSIRMQYNNTKKKLYVLKLYLNVVIGTISLRYIDILIRVKYGGVIFSFFTLGMFYFSNKYYNKYSILKCAEEIASYNKEESLDTYIRSIRKESDIKNKEDRLTKLRLSKYWKEPMAWH